MTAGFTHQLEHLLIDEVNPAVTSPMNIDIFGNHVLAQLNHLIPANCEQIGVHVNIMDA